MFIFIKKKLQRTSLKLVKMVLPTVTPVKRSVTLRNASLTAAPVSAGANFHTIAPELVPFRVELHCTAQHSTVRIPIVMSSRERKRRFNINLFNRKKRAIDCI